MAGARGRRWRLEALERGAKHHGYVQCSSRERAVEVCRSMRVLGAEGAACRVNGSRVYVCPVGRGIAAWWDESGVLMERVGSPWWMAKDPGGRRSRPRPGMFYDLRHDRVKDENWLEELLAEDANAEAI